jgi:class 3 adenylate cyclase/TolB-like protein/Flp pilus assembly protein TadD
MNAATLTRKLTTIIVLDVAGYSRLMGQDEEGTHVRLAALRSEVLEPSIARRDGTLVKDTGDGLLAEFSSVVEAARCALEIQEGAAERNKAVPPHQHMAFRIGINLGDVIVAGQDIYGDGVNTAARLQAIAPPGGIVVSRAVRDHIRDKLAVVFEDMGEQHLKNIARPVRAFQIKPSADNMRAVPAVHRVSLRGARLWGSGILAMFAAAGGSWWLMHPAAQPTMAPSTAASAPGGARPASGVSIAVLPFANLSGDANQDYLSEGITDSLTTDLSRALPGTFVISRGTASTYKGTALEPAQVGRDLKVRYVLMGSVSTDPDRVRINAQLIDAHSNAQLWAERFDKKRTDLLTVEDEIVGRLSRAVGLEVVNIEAKRSERERSGDPTSLDFVMRAQAVANRPTSRETMIQARGLFQQALQFAPSNADALAGIAYTYVSEVLNSYYEKGRGERLRDADSLIRKALALESRHIVALKTRAALLRAEGRFEEAIAANEVVIAQNPGEPWSHKEVGLSHLYLGHFQEALNWFEKADQIGPRDPSRWIWLGAMGRIHLFRDNNGEAIRLLRLSAEANPNDSRAYALLAAVYALSGRADDAHQALSDCLRLQPDMTVKRLAAIWSVPLSTTNATYLHAHERIQDGLRLAGMPEG